MKKSLLHRLAQLGLVLSAGLSSLAHAGLVSYDTTVGTFGRQADTRDRLSYRRFDADLGVLREVRFTFDIGTHYTMVLYNESVDPRRFDLMYGSSVEFDAPERWVATNDQYERQTVDANTPQTVLQRSWSTQRSFSVTRDLDRYIGDTAAWMDYRLFHSADGYWDGGSREFGSMSTTEVRVRLDYLYDAASPTPGQPLPEPGSLALALAACAAAGIGRRTLSQRSA